MKTYGMIMSVYGFLMAFAVVTLLVLAGCDAQGGASFLGAAGSGPVSTDGLGDDSQAADSSEDPFGRRLGTDRCRLQGALEGVGHHLLSSGKASYEKRGGDRRISVQVEDIDLSLAGRSARVIVGGQFGTALDQRIQIGCLDAACLLGAFDLNLDTRDLQGVPDFTGKTNCADALVKVTVLDANGAVIVMGMMIAK